MARLSDLPLELLSLICGNLVRLYDLQNASKSCVSLRQATRLYLEQYEPWLQNARNAIAVFAEEDNVETIPSLGRIFPSFPGSLPRLTAGFGPFPDEVPKSDYQKFGLDPAKAPYVRSSPPDLRSWMHLDGSLQWLQPLDAGMRREWDGYYGGEDSGNRLASPSQVDELFEVAKRLGLVLPAGLDKFLRSKRLHHRIPSMSAWYFKLDELVRCPPKFDNGQGGYMFRFYYDQQCCSYAYLYLNPAGQHCVLGSSMNIYYSDDENDGDDDNDDDDEEEDDDAEEKEEEEDNDIATGQMEKMEFILIGLTFEEYLVTTYYNELIAFEAKPFPGLCEYVQHVYRSPGEIQHMKNMNGDVKNFLKAWNWQDN